MIGLGTVVAGEAGFATTPNGRGAMLRAYDKGTGKDAGAVYMPAGQTGSPMSRESWCVTLPPAHMRRCSGIGGRNPPRAGCRVVCYCDDCQAFARFLACPGITDERGGTGKIKIGLA